MPKFVPLTFLNDAASIVEFCQECGEPIFVTRNETPKMVIMDNDFFNEYLCYRKEDADWISGESLPVFRRRLQSRN